MFNEEKVIEYIKKIGYDKIHSKRYVYKYVDSYINIAFRDVYYTNSKTFITFQHDNYDMKTLIYKEFSNEIDFYSFFNKYHIKDIRNIKMKKIG